MIQVDVIQCNGCGATLAPQNMKCNYCGSENVIIQSANLFNLNPKQSSQLATSYNQQIDSNPGDTNAMFGMGLIYLNLKNYDLARQKFKAAIDIEPFNSDMYYYYVLSIIGGRKPRKLIINDIKRIEEYLNTSIGIAPQQKHFMLLAVVKADFYEGNSLRMPEPGPANLLEQARNYSAQPDEMEQMLKHVSIKDENILSNL